MEFTEAQKREFKATYAKRRRIHLAGLIALAAVMIGVALTEDRVGDAVMGVSVNIVGPVFLALVVTGWVIFTSRVWRCPACNEYLGRNSNPKQCRRCGVELRGKPTVR